MDSETVRDAQRDARLEYTLGRRSVIAWKWPNADDRDAYGQEWTRHARFDWRAIYGTKNPLGS